MYAEKKPYTDLVLYKLEPLYEERWMLEATMLEETEAGNHEIAATMKASMAYLMPEIRRLEAILQD